jgi:hypothetical protein
MRPRACFPEWSANIADDLRCLTHIGADRREQTMQADFVDKSCGVLCYHNAMSDAEDEERALRMEQMTVNIEKMRFDMAETQRQSSRDLRKFIVTTVVSAVLATAAAVGAGIAIGSYFTKQPGPPIVIQLPAPSK